MRGEIRPITTHRKLRMLTSAERQNPTSSGRVSPPDRKRRARWSAGRRPRGSDLHDAALDGPAPGRLVDRGGDGRRPGLGAAIADELGRLCWAARDEFSFPAFRLQDCARQGRGRARSGPIVLRATAPTPRPPAAMAMATSCCRHCWRQAGKDPNRRITDRGRSRRRSAVCNRAGHRGDRGGRPGRRVTPNSRRSVSGAGARPRPGRDAAGPAVGTRPTSVGRAPAGRHSRHRAQRTPALASRFGGVPACRSRRPPLQGGAGEVGGRVSRPTTRRLPPRSSRSGPTGPLQQRSAAPAVRRIPRPMWPFDPDLATPWLDGETVMRPATQLGP